jgi:hypothetical protein
MFCVRLCSGRVLGAVFLLLRLVLGRWVAEHNQRPSVRREVARFEWMRGLEVRLMS